MIERVTAKTQVQPGSILLDVSSLRSALAAVREKSKTSPSDQLRDIDIVGLAHLVETIILAPDVLCLNSEVARMSAFQLGLSELPFVRFLEIDAGLIEQLERAPHKLQVHEFVWRAQGETQASMLELVGLAFRAATGSGYDLINSCRKSTYEYLTGVAPDNSPLLTALHAWHTRNTWHDSELTALNERLADSQATALRRYAISSEGRRKPQLPANLLEQISLESETERLLMVLYWLIDRAVFYFLLSISLGAVYFPSSLRSNLFALTSMVLANPDREITHWIPGAADK
jgi:hypothetical protein